MSIVNNISSNMILGELHKNTKKKDKASAQLALGEKIRNAGDDASGLAISEKMRVRIRALGQDEANVKNGASMLRTAEGAIQSQINLLRTIKEKVIDAHNDTNTDTDRMIIQKEISQYYDEINDIAAETTFNKKLLLLGNTVQETVKSWVVMDHAELVEGSDSLGLINTTEGNLDGEPGPFATFGTSTDSPAYDGYSIKAADTSNIPGFDNTVAPTTSSSATISKMHDGGDNKPHIFEINLSGINNAALNGSAFTVTGCYESNGSYYTYTKDYVLTTDPTNNTYVNKNSNQVISGEINISGMSNAQAAAAIRSRLTSDFGSNYYTVEGSGETIKLTSKVSGAVTNNISYCNVAGIDVRSVDDSLPTGVGSFGLTGGKDTTYKSVSGGTDPNTDLPITNWVVDQPAVIATATKSLSDISAGGITLSYNSREYYVKFEDSNNAPAYNTTQGYWTVGKGWTGKFNPYYLIPPNNTSSQSCAVNIELSGGNIIFTATSAGSWGNYCSIKDGISVAGGSPLTGISTTQKGADGDRAYWNWDLSAYNVSDADKADELIEGLVGKTFSHSTNSTSSAGSRVSYYNFEFIDSSKAPSLDSIYKINSSYQIDLKKIRDEVTSGKTVSEAFASLLLSAIGSKYQIYNPTYDSSQPISEDNPRYVNLIESTKNGADEVTGIKIKASVTGKTGNDQYLSFKEGELRDYTIDFADYFASNGGDIASTLDGKGIRFYCATDKSQWVNVQFVNGISAADDDRPKSGTDSLDIKTFVVDVSDVTDVRSLVKTIYEGDGNKNPKGLADWLLHDYNHMFELAADYDEGTITIYDKRRFTLNSSSYVVNDKGAKIADGVLDNVKQDKRYVYVNDLVIHHTDRSSANIHVRIPQTTMDHIFGYKVGTYSLDDYSVLTSEKREKLLGTDGPPKVEGTLDKGLQYLIDANTLIGAQIFHMEFAEANIITDQESTMSAESVIRDADMAKSSLDLATAQILSQTGQAMLSQSNQNSSNVLSLLQ
ncbi:hypothetical protein NZ47_04620 [Anaerovibrio lipolyticus]|uniref:Flagellin n=1 Tax=Anaerovibrio lipolyticus TaxID=82374 RepID=A0A0B2K0J8_9FIRM|nr:flagellin [Anaerovibrio lipolyticus]KHM52483.1 hypothetical protein NZ47_04620 [Anaerovibrio lipolyticus]